MSPWIKDQYAYMPKCSTTLALVKAYQTWLSNLENRDTSMVRVLLADMSKAFDRVDHGILLQLLAVRATPPKMLGWIHSYLTGLKQRVVTNNQQSNWNVVTSGVPQGGVLSPYLFLVYMSSRETVHQTTSNIGYGDDIGLSRTFTCDTVESDTTMQEEATQLDTWANKNNMIMNGDKSYELRLSFSKNPPVPPPLTLGGKEVPVVECATYLGFKLHRSLGWDSQILHMAKKGSTRLHFLRMLKKGGMPPEDLETVYMTLIRPVLEYANVVYVGCYTKQNNTLEAVQRRAARINYGKSTQTTPFSTLLDRRETAAKTLLKQMRHVSHPLHSLMPCYRHQSTRRSLRNGNHIFVPKFRTERLRKSFLFQAISLSNQDL
ncbi:hypothetical protein Bbelb_124310 [Branchiostoma belcheri]|nr:hypothetical protein Bbelb_124310 [Branchiostoma belcheri]